MASSRNDPNDLITGMPEKNWEKIKDLFHEALRCNSSERALFLDHACAGDTGLRSEVESLLMSLDEARTFLEMPVIRESAEPNASWQLENGHQISHYRIVKPIGSGGMGEVYLADDERLGRQVALKVLPQEMLEDESRLRRFEREANAVSALNHPNILTIFEFAEENGIHFFASEFVKGITLRQQIDRGRPEVVEVLEIAIQITSALQAAHEAGVVHRDIKPENLMIREDGYVKVLDFGLAKQIEKVIAGQTDTTLTQRFSLPGVIMGTVTYMSPEQARGTHVDARSDIFTLGIVIYEMLTGQPPFKGETATDVLAEVVQTDPPRPSILNPDVSDELDDIVIKALAKNPLDRPQNAKMLLTDLKGLLKRLEFNAELERTAKNDGSVNIVKNEQVTSIARGGSDQNRSYLPDLTPLIGREQEIERLTDLLVDRRSRLVTLTGIGGTGKTRLAQELCRRLKGEYSDGFVFVRLAEIHDPSLVPAVISHQVRVQEIVGKPISETLKDFLQEKRLLLVLDNFEQVMEAAPFVSDLLTSANYLSVLVTSRERLHVQAETEFNVPPLPIPDDDVPTMLEDLARFDSVKLFVERSRQVNSDFQLTEENAEQVAKICSMLDGLPLAIELAAARTRIFSAATIVEKLETRLAFLTGGAIDLPKRQQTMRAAVDWSYDLLNDDEKRLFRRLSVFACRFTAAAAETIASDTMSDAMNGNLTRSTNTALHSVEFLDRFASLADKSLIIRRQHADGDITYSLLEIVREYAESILETDDDADDIRRRHARYYLSLAEKAEPYLQSKDTAFWINQLEDEYENIRSALLWSIKKEPQIAARLAAAIRQFWLTRGYLSEGIGWAEQILDQDVEIPAQTRWKILTVSGNISQFQGDIKKAYSFYDQALNSARLSENQKYVAQSLRGLGATAYLQYDFVDARKLINEAIELSRSIGDDFGLAAAMARLGDISSLEGDRIAARDLTERALAIFRRIGYLEGISAKLYNLGAIVFLDGDHETAQKHFEEAHSAALDIGEKINTRLIFDGFAALAAEKGDYVRAAKLSGAAESLGATIGYAIEPAEQMFRDAYIGKLRAAVPDDEFERERAAGRGLSTEEARGLAYSKSDGKSISTESTSGDSKTLEMSPRLSASDNSSKSAWRLVSKTTKSQKLVLAAFLSALFLALAAALAYWLYASDTSNTRQIESIAVIPFANESGNQDAEYLSDGISEALINNLTELRQLKVIARTTAFRYKGKDIDPQVIGRELNVRTVLMGSVRQIGDRITVQVDLVDADSGTQLWGEEYDREMSDIISVKQTIARQVIDKLRFQLSGEEQQRMARRDTQDVEAYEFYLRGRYLWNKRTAESVQKAIEQFQQAIDRDPNYALGYVGLADCYLLLEELAGIPASETLPKARDAIDHATRIDDSLSEAHTSSGYIFEQLWQWTEAGKEYDRAISLNPNYLTAHHWLSIFYRRQGQYDKSLSEIKRAQELDPLSPIIGQNVAEIDLIRNDINSAIAECRKIIDLNPSFPGAHDELGFAYVKQQRFGDAIAEFRKAVELSGNASRYQGDLGYGLAIAGKRADAQAILKDLETKYVRHTAIGLYLAAVYSGLGDKDQAFAWLEKDYERHSGARLPFIRWESKFDGLRDDPRFGDLLRRINLPQN